MGRAFLPRMERTVEAAVSQEVPIPVTFEEFFRTNSQDLYGSLWLVTRHRFEAEGFTTSAASTQTVTDLVPAPKHDPQL